MRKLILLSFVLISTSNLWGQETRISRNKTAIRSSLVDWDPIRGDWLASSLFALSENQPAPERTFPERLTATQLFQFVPVIKRDSVEQLLRENDQLRRLENDFVLNLGFDFIRIMGSINGDRTLRSGFTFGEPHIVDFDGTYIRNTSLGEYTLAKSNNSDFEVQGRFETIQSNASFVTAASIMVGGDIVAFYPNDKPDNISYSALRINGEAVTMQNLVYYLPMGGLITYDDKRYRIDSPTGETVIIEIKRYMDKKYLNIAMQVFEEDQTDYEGLSVRITGDNNAYRVNENTSLFSYSVDKDALYFSELKQKEPFNRFISMEERASGRKVCSDAKVGEAEIEGCIYDYVHFQLEPSPRPTISQPVDEIELTELESSSIYTNETIARLNQSEESSSTIMRKSRPEWNQDSSQLKQDVSGAILRVLAGAMNSAGRGGSTLGGFGSLGGR